MPAVTEPYHFHGFMLQNRQSSAKVVATARLPALLSRSLQAMLNYAWNLLRPLCLAVSLGNRQRFGVMRVIRGVEHMSKLQQTILRNSCSRCRRREMSTANLLCTYANTRRNETDNKGTRRGMWSKDDRNLYADATRKNCFIKVIFTNGTHSPRSLIPSTL